MRDSSHQGATVGDAHGNIVQEPDFTSDLATAVVDAPVDLPNTIPSVWEVTHPDLAIVRLHGRNHATWNLKGLRSSAERFNYDYTTEELVDVAERTRELSRQAEITQVIFNNNYEDQGQRNGREMIKLLAARA